MAKKGFWTGLMLGGLIGASMLLFWQDMMRYSCSPNPESQEKIKLVVDDSGGCDHC